jgi:MoaA/NifB/PqqE/SkfB family radical SAM enzyme
VCRAVGLSSPRPLKAILSDIAKAVSSGISCVAFPDHNALLHPGWEKIASACRKHSLEFIVSTSGAGLDAKGGRIGKLVGQGLVGVRYLLASFDPEVNQLVWGTGEAELSAVSGLELVHGSGLLKVVNIPVTPFNRGGLDRTVLELDAWLGMDIGFVDPERRFGRDIRRALSRVDVRSGERAPDRPGRMNFRQIGNPFPFDPAGCPFRSGDRENRLSTRRVLLEHSPGLYAPYESGERRTDLLILSKNIRGLLSRATAAGIIPYKRHDSCSGCARLVSCGGIFIRDGRTCLRPITGKDSHAPSDLWLLLDGSPKRFSISGRSPVCLAVDRHVQVPPDPGPGWEPWEIADAAEVHGYGVEEYDLDRDAVTGGWTVTFSRKAPSIKRKFRSLAVLQLSSACVARCVMCNLPVQFAGKWVRSPEASRLLEELYLLGYQTCDVFGGEITLRPDFAFLMGLAKEIGMRAFFITTGYGLDAQKVRKLAEAGVDKCSVALDALSPGLNDAIKNRTGLHTQAMKTIRLVLADGRIPLEVNSVLVRQNLHEMLPLHRELAGLGVERHRIFYCIDVLYGMGEPPYLTRRQATEFVRKVHPGLEKSSSKLGTLIDWCPPVSIGSRPAKEEADRISRGVYTDTSTGCRAPDSDIFITVEGLVYPCVNPSVFQIEPIGRVGEGKLLDMLGGRRFRKFSRNAGKMKLCENCISKRI